VKEMNDETIDAIQVQCTKTSFSPHTLLCAATGLDGTALSA